MKNPYDKKAQRAEALRQQRINDEANLVLLCQQLEPIRAKATRYFQDFELKGKRRFWLLPNETLEDGFMVNPMRVEYVLKNLDWFVKTITESEQHEQ